MALAQWVMARKVTSMDVWLMAAVSDGVGTINVAQLCGERGVSRQTFYKWRRRFEADGLEASGSGSWRKSTRSSAMSWATSCAGRHNFHHVPLP